jgi:hypothetical protein
LLRRRLQGGATIVILRVRFSARQKSSGNQCVGLQYGMKYCEGAKKEVDDERETLHNLTSLLLTNTTIREAQQGSTKYGSLTINSR